jgi:hypothetical protein
MPSCASARLRRLLQQQPQQQIEIQREHREETDFVEENGILLQQRIVLIAAMNAVHDFANRPVGGRREGPKKSPVLPG